MITASAFRTYLLAHPEATNVDIAEALEASEENVRVYLWKQKSKGRLYIDTDENGSRRITIDPSWTTDSEVQMNETKTKKQEIYTRMLDVFIDDFEVAQGYQERAEIGKLILRLLEKI